MIMKYAITLFLLLLAMILSYGQIESNKWLLSNNNVIYFDSEITVSDFAENINPQLEGTAVVMGSEGDILFTATATAIYNSDWDIITNGGNLHGSETGNTAQTPIVLQKPGSETEYYILYTQDHINPETEGDLKYSILNICDENNEMSILEHEKNVSIEGDFSERLHIVEIDRNNYWLFATELFKRKLLAFKIDENGISNTPIISEIDNSFDGQIGKIKVNHNKTKLAWSSTFSSTSRLSTYDFNINTGKVSNQRIISNGQIYGIEWSISDQFLYYTDIYAGSGVYSYSMNDGTINTLYERSGHYQVGDLKFSPQKDRVIVAQSHNNKLGQITDLENGGLYSELDLEFLGYFDMNIGLQEQVINYGLDIPSIIFSDESLTINQEESFTEVTLNGIFTDIVWSDGQTGNSAIFSEEGVYQVEAYYNCHLVCAEFEIIIEEVFTPECDQIFDGSNIMDEIIFYHDFGGDGVDQSTNGLNAVIENSVKTVDRFLVNDEALSFNKNSNVYIPSNEKLKIDYPFSFSLWAFFESDAQFDNAIFSSNFVQDDYHGVGAFRNINGDVSLFVGNGIGNTGSNNRMNIVSQNAEIEINMWTHIVFIMDGPGSGSIYVNGCKMQTEYVGSGTWDIAYSDDPAVFGTIDTNTGPGIEDHALIGSLDDFYFWSRSITEEEVLYLYDRFEVPEIELQEAYTILNGQDDITIDLPIDYTDVLWSDGQIGNTGVFSSEGTYQVEAYYKCHLVCGEFNVEKEIVVPPIDSCGIVQFFNSHCGTSKYHCVVSDELGNSKYYFEGQIQLPEDYSICETDLNDAISSVQNIYVFELIQTGQTVDFRAFATILDFDVFVSEGLILDINICNGMEQGCISYVLPYGTCSNDYGCTIDYKGIYFRDNASVNIDYCMVLHDISNDDCSSEYMIEVYLMNSSSEKLIFEETVTEDLDFYNCISVPLSIDDFLSNEYNCIELRITDKCTGESCFRYDCNLFNSQQNQISELNENSNLEEDNVSVSSRNEALDLSISPFPNPTKSQISFFIQEDNSSFELRTSHGELIEVPFSVESNLVKLDMDHLTNGVYFLSRKIDNQYTTQRIIKID